MTAWDRLFWYLVELELIKFKLNIIYKCVYSYDVEGKYMFYILISYTHFDTEKLVLYNTKITLKFYHILLRYVINCAQLLSRKWNFPIWSSLKMSFAFYDSKALKWDTVQATIYNNYLDTQVTFVVIGQKRMLVNTM